VGAPSRPPRPAPSAARVPPCPAVRGTTGTTYRSEALASWSTNLGSECGDLQGLRELTVNELEAIAALGQRAERVAWSGISTGERFDASGGRCVRKLSVIDIGIGMRPRCDALLHQPPSRLQATSRGSHVELRGRSQGRGRIAQSARGSNTAPGIRAGERRSSASSATMTAAGDSSRSSGPTAAATSGVRSASHEKPWVLRGRPHGTQVVLLGQHEREDTTQAPKSVTEGRQRCSRKSCSQHAASATRRTGAATTSPRSCRPPH
jgi:hypothetical protein